MPYLLHIITLWTIFHCNYIHVILGGQKLYTEGTEGEKQKTAFGGVFVVLAFSFGNP